MKVSDYIVKILEDNNITDVFGIPGVGCGHFMNSLIASRITNHLVYNEQGAAFAACGYAQASNGIGMAYSTAGPGGTNLVTGIANAYADSIPTLFMVGEKDLNELKGELRVRQKASQEIDIVEVAKPITKWSYQVKKKDEVRYTFEKALHIAMNERPGPVLIDLPSDIARADVDINDLKGYVPKKTKKNNSYIVEEIRREIGESKRPVFLAGNAIRQNNLTQQFVGLSTKLNIPFVSTLVAFDAFNNVGNYLGYIGMDGDPSANNAVAECDLLITFGARLNFKQIGHKREVFAGAAKIIRIDVDPEELAYEINGKEVKICADVKDIIPALNDCCIVPASTKWISYCKEQCKGSKRKGSLNPVGDVFMKAVLSGLPSDAQIVVDTGSHRRWLMSQIELTGAQRVYQSAGLASMGYALPAAIGVYYSSKRAPICINGDGGIMMNLQELQLVRRENIPMTIFVFNNHVLGDIMEFQKHIFNKSYFATTEGSGYLSADYEGIAKAFHFNYKLISDIDDINSISYHNEKPQLVEIAIPSNE